METTNRRLRLARELKGSTVTLGGNTDVVCRGQCNLQHVQVSKPYDPPGE